MLSRPEGSGSAVAEVVAEPAEVPDRGPVGRTLRRLTTHGVHVVSNLCGDDVVGRNVRVALIRAAGADLARGVIMGGGTYISRPANLVVGPKSFIGRNGYLDLESQLVIGSQVAIGHGVSFITTKHEVGPPELRCGKFTSEAITVGDGAWVGANVTVLPGVSIGRGAVVAAGSVVPADVPDNTVVGGLRARAIKSLD